MFAVHRIDENGNAMELPVFQNTFTMDELQSVADDRDCILLPAPRESRMRGVDCFEIVESPEYRFLAIQIR